MKSDPLIPYEVNFNVGEKNKDIEIRQTHFKNCFPHQIQSQNFIENQNVYTSSPKPREPNRYPPLFFTFQDFQTVMEESISKRDCHTSLEETFSSNNLIDESKVCFRVTTTNIPFEKCLETWQNTFDNPEFKDCDENLFIFEDYIDRSKLTNSRPDLFRIESLENSLEDIMPNRTKVRFVIESPSTSSPDENAEITEDSLKNIESLNKDLEELQKIQSICEEIQNSQEESKNNKVPFDSLLCDEDDYDLVEVQSEADLLCIKHVEDKSKDVSIELSKTNEITYSSEESFTEEKSQILPANPSKLKRYKTCMSSDHDIPESENFEQEYFKRQKEILSNVSRLQSLNSKIQKSGSGSYEDAFDSEELILTASDKSERAEDAKTNLVHLEASDNQNNTVNTQIEIKVNQEMSFKKKQIFIDSTLCDFINDDDNKIKWNESSDEEEAERFAKHEISNLNFSSEAETIPINGNEFKINLESKSGDIMINSKSFETEIEEHNPQVSSVPVSVRRNSFLDKMLNEENACAVIATHPKLCDSKLEKEMLPTCLELKSSEQEFLALQIGSNRKVPKISSGVEETRNKDQKVKISEKKKEKNLKKDKISETKSVGEVKCDVLNELLCNFSAIKLKSVARSNVDRDPSANHVKLPVQSACKQKTDELRVKKYGSASARITDPNEALVSVEDRLDSVDKCAIARRSSKTCNNSIDNNAKTPVALSNDQSHNAFSITPGSVRNFIKHYEIHQETNNQSCNENSNKNEDNTFKHMENDCKNRDNNCNDRDCQGKDIDKTAKTSSMKNQQETLELKQEANKNFLLDLTNSEDAYDLMGRCMSENIASLKEEYESSCQSLSPNENRCRRQSCIKSNDSSPTSERKKSVQFDSACTVIQLQKQDEGSMSSLINGIRSRIKGKAPNKTEMLGPITFKTTLRPDDSTPQIQVSYQSFYIVYFRI